MSDMQVFVCVKNVQTMWPSVRGKCVSSKARRSLVWRLMDIKTDRTTPGQIWRIRRLHQDHRTISARLDTTISCVKQNTGTDTVPVFIQQDVAKTSPSEFSVSISYFIRKCYSSNHRQRFSSATSQPKYTCIRRIVLSANINIILSLKSMEVSINNSANYLHEYCFSILEMLYLIHI